MCIVPLVSKVNHIGPCYNNMRFKSAFEKIYLFLFFYLLQINMFLVFSNYFDMLVSKVIFFLKKYYFNIFWYQNFLKK
jgi:hypothetical protein